MVISKISLYLTFNSFHPKNPAKGRRKGVLQFFFVHVLKIYGKTDFVSCEKNKQAKLILKDFFYVQKRVATCRVHFNIFFVGQSAFTKSVLVRNSAANSKIKYGWFCSIHCSSSR